MRAWPLALFAAVLATAALGDPAPPASLIDLSKPFHTRSPWRLVVTQGPQVEDFGGAQAPGELTLCLAKAHGGPCMSDGLSPPPTANPELSKDWGPHYLNAAVPVYPQGRAASPLLMLVTASLHGGNGSQAVVTQLLKYDRARDAFARIYFHDVGTNNNDEIRFIADGPLRGDVISAEPTENAPFGYWVTVNQLTPARTYRQALRYRSSTHYNDGNQLAVIDSEMPNIERRLGLWKPGSPLPLPAGKPCLHPTLKRSELWCG